MTTIIKPDTTSIAAPDGTAVTVTAIGIAVEPLAATDPLLAANRAQAIYCHIAPVSVRTPGGENTISKATPIEPTSNVADTELGAPE